jgi:hypothetical protein
MLEVEGYTAFNPASCARRSRGSSVLRRSSGDDVRPTSLVGHRGPLMHATFLSRNPGFLMSTLLHIQEQQ